MSASLQTRVHSRQCTFFRQRLLTSNYEEIQTYINGLQQEAKQIRTDSLKLSWYMRGGITYDQVLMLSPMERRAISEIVKENYETTKKSGLPHF